MDTLEQLIQDPDSYWILYDLCIENNWAEIRDVPIYPFWIDLGAGNYLFSSVNLRILTGPEPHSKSGFNRTSNEQERW